MVMDCEVQTANVSNKLDMEFGWNSEIFPALSDATQYAVDATDLGVQPVSSASIDAFNFPGTSPSLPQYGPFAREYDNFGNTMDPTTLWPASMDNPNAPSKIPLTHTFVQPFNGSQIRQSSLSSSPFDFARGPRSAERASSTSTTTNTIPSVRSSPFISNTPSSNTGETAVASSPGESDKTRRARYAANQRHSKAQKARKDSHHADNDTSAAEDLAQKRKERHREKNKIAAAKCRSRQRKQVQTIQDKGSHLAEKNAELKAMIQKLRGELNGLRSMALEHQHCNCHVTRYNQSQAERVVAEYRSSCMAQQVGSFAQPH